MTYYVYILTNYGETVLYIGCTSNIERRLWEHGQGVGSDFVRKYNGAKLVYAEQYPNAESMISREKQLKGWRREKKNNLINAINPRWDDLKSHYED